MVFKCTEVVLEDPWPGMSGTRRPCKIKGSVNLAPALSLPLYVWTSRRCGAQSGLQEGKRNGPRHSPDSWAVATRKEKKKEEKK